MLRIEIKEGENIERALKRYKRKHRKTKLMDNIRERQQYTKPSAARRQIQQKAEYRQRYELEHEDDN
jgi:small subunit ribosomal protein S21